MNLLDSSMKTFAPEVQELCQALLLLESESECRCFLRDLLTEQELFDLALRWKAARLLDQGLTYVQIEEETGLSSATIARISKWLHDGAGGYRKILDKLS